MSGLSAAPGAAAPGAGVPAAGAAAAAPRGLRASVAGRVGGLEIDVAIDTGPGTLALVGANGAGKSSVLLMVLGILPSRRARVEVGGALLADSDAGVDVPVELRRLGYVPQDYALFPHLTVRENVAFALRCRARAHSMPHGSTGGSAHAMPHGTEESTVDSTVDAILDDLGLRALAARRPRTLSGGEKQRVTLARALALGPRALLLDEPLAALDVRSREEVGEFLASWLARAALPTVVVTHDAREARRLAPRAAVLEEGRVLQAGTWAELEAGPASAFVRSFVGGS